MHEKIESAVWRMNHAELTAAWEGFTANRKNRELREALVSHYFPYVEEIARRSANRLPSHLDIMELVSAGSWGLLDAVNRFDPSVGTKFETFAYQRISGAITDELRRLDPVPRPVRHMATRIARARARLESIYGRPAHEDEIASHLELSLEDYRKVERESRIHTMIPLDRKGDGDNNNEVDPLETLPDYRSANPLKTMILEEVKQQAMLGLSEEQKAVLIMYYEERLSLKEIGMAIGKSESRVCQIHNLALSFVMEKHRQQSDEFASVLS